MSANEKPAPATPVVAAESVPGAPPIARQDFDVLEMPMEGLVAYWLSIKKLWDLKKSRKFVDEEAQYTEEPFVRYLLEIGFAAFSDEQVRELAAVRKGRILADYGRKFELVITALAAMAQNENPRLTLIRLLTFFAAPPLPESKAVELAQGVLRGLADEAADRATLLTIDHKLRVDRLLVKLLVYCMYARREGLPALAAFLPYVKPYFVSESLKLVIDGFEAAFVREHAGRLKAALLTETEAKMDLCVQMLAAIRARLSYDDVYLAAKAYLA